MENQENCHMSQGDGHKLKINTKIVRIEYPGIIQNTERAIETLGGICNIEKVRTIYFN